MAKTVTRAYGTDLAYIHDTGHAAFAKRTSSWLLPTLKNRGLGGGLVIDLGCGSGIMARTLTRAGHDVLGVDISPSMIALARKNAPGISFLCSSFMDAPLPPCVAVLSIGECIGYGFDGRVAGKGIGKLFRRIHKALEPGGLFVFDFLAKGIRPRRPGYRTGKDWACLSSSEIDASGNKLTRHITSFRKSGKLFRRIEETHHLHLHDRASLMQEIRDTGFRAQYIRGYGDMKFSPGHVGILARKP